MGDAAGRRSGVQLVTIDEGNAGQRLDNFLIGRLKGVPRSWVYRVLRRGEVRVNRGRSRPERRLHAGDVVRIPPVREAERAQAPRVPPRLIETLEDAILYEDDALLVLNKPSGIAVHGGSGLAHGVIEVLRAGRPRAPYLELAHRLDRDTSGCLMVAKKRAALRELQELQRAGQVQKRYRALLAGRVRTGAWRVDLPLRKNTLHGGERVVRVDPQGKAAATRFAVVERYGDCTLVEVTLETGRTHQIRVHAAHGGHPVLGDARYGDAAADRVARRLGLRRLFLHASSFALKGRVLPHRLSVEAPLDPALQACLDNLGPDNA
jgi:23S rRNA pseudouridine955/2504/2580 synthase